MTHNWIRYLVPTEWTGRQALAVVELLKQATDAIWLVHGERMADALGDDRDLLDHLDRFVQPEESPDDDIPF